MHLTETRNNSQSHLISELVYSHDLVIYLVFLKFLIIIYDVLGAVLSPQDEVVNRTFKNPCL